MNQIVGKCVFAILFVLLFIGGLYIQNGLKMDATTLASIPIIMFAETIVFGMVYATIFHSENPGRAH